MQSAYLYIRVSTDEQAIKGYSQRSQLDRLTRYCIAHNVAVLETILEDHSAKTFDRPAWCNMMYELRHGKTNQPNLILFTKWDRFSRNIGDAYYMISQLNRFVITAHAIDQELDLSIPENKIILAVYLSTSEAENDRRSLNVRQGIHKAKQEGRWTAHVPLGYKSQIALDKKRNIVPVEPAARLIRKAFDMVAENRHTVQTVYKVVTANGLKCSISNFRRLLRNPVYCGKIAIPAFEHEVAYLVNGIHEPLVNENLFSRVQDFLSKATTKGTSHINQDAGEQLFLRGFFFCPNCNRRLTGSGSRGKLGVRYYYYHCRSSCGFRMRADKINAIFVRELSILQVDEKYLQLYGDILKHIEKDLYNADRSEKKNVIVSMDRLIERIVKAK